MALPSLAELETAATTVHAVMPPTPQRAWPLLSARTGTETWVKHENHTPIGAFKVRGGLTFTEALKREQPNVSGIIAATRGNHGQSIAFAAARHGLKATIVVPHGNSQGKNAAMRTFGAELIEHGADFQEALEWTIAEARQRDLFLVPSFDLNLVRGVATYAMELFQAAGELDAVYVPIGLGSGICGVMAARDALGLKTDVIGVVSENAAAYALSFAQGEPVSTNSANTIADGMACRVPVPEALNYIMTGAARVITVSDDSVLDAMAAYFTDTHNIAEGAGAAPLAALMSERSSMAGKRVGIILSGGNVDPALYRDALTRCDSQ